MKELALMKYYFYQTRQEALDAYILWQHKQKYPDLVHSEVYYLDLYRQAWARHERASMSYFLAEVKELGAEAVNID